MFGLSTNFVYIWAISPEICEARKLVLVKQCMTMWDTRIGLKRRSEVSFRVYNFIIHIFSRPWFSMSQKDHRRHSEFWWPKSGILLKVEMGRANFPSQAGLMPAFSGLRPVRADDFDLFSANFCWFLKDFSTRRAIFEVRAQSGCPNSGRQGRDSG